MVIKKNKNITNHWTTKLEIALGDGLENIIEAQLGDWRGEGAATPQKIGKSTESKIKQEEYNRSGALMIDSV